MAKDYFKGLDSASKKITKAQNKYADFAGEVAKLPYQLTDEYRKAQDPALSASINKSEQNMFSAPITALETYKDISDPTTRRALAEKAAGTATVDYKNLTDERTRREGVYSDYVAKWTGLYGAEAAKEQAKVNSQVDSWNRDMNIAGQKQTQANRVEDNAESRRRWDYEQAHKGGSGATSANSDYLSYAQDQLDASQGMTENKGYHSSVYTKLLISAPDDKTRAALKEYFSGGLDEGGKLKLGIETSKPETPAQTVSRENSEQDLIKKKNENKAANKFYSSIKDNRESAGYGEKYYDKDGNIRKRSWGLASNDEIIE